MFGCKALGWGSRIDKAWLKFLNMLTQPLYCKLWTPYKEQWLLDYIPDSNNGFALSLAVDHSSRDINFVHLSKLSYIMICFMNQRLNPAVDPSIEDNKKYALFIILCLKLIGNLIK